MAKKISDEVIKLNIVINGNEAQKEILDLEKSNIKLRETLKSQLAEQKKLQRQKKTDTDEYKALTAEINKNTRTLEANEVKVRELASQLNLTEMTMAQLRQRAAVLNATLRHLVPGTEDYKKYRTELDAVNAQMGKLRDNGKAASWSIGSLADKFNRYAALAASAVAALTGVVLSIQKMIDFNSKLADKMTDVQKTTGMTKREVDELAKSFGLLKTRTGRIELLGIAEVGGRLGIAKEEIGDFVKVMNKAGVALGDSFEGGPEVVADKLGKIKGLYDQLKNSGVEAAFESVGSALNDLGAAGTASEANVAEFAQRVGDLPGALKPSIQQALGLGAAFEESGLKAELAATNYGKVISIAARDTGAFAKVMGRNKKELEDLINTDPTEFFLQFSKSLKGLDATDLAKILDYLKLNDNEVKMVLGAAADNTQLFRDKIELAKQSMADATSLTTEYDLKNNNLAATLARLKKAVEGWFTSDSVVKFLESSVNWLAKFVGAIEDSEGSVTGWRNAIVFTAKVLSVLVTGMFSYVTAAKLIALWSSNVATAVSLSNIVFRIQYAQLVVQEVATKALALAQALLSFNITRVKTAYQALTVAMGMNPFGALLAVIAAVTTAFIVFGDEANKATEVLKAQVEIQKEISEQTSKTKQRVTDLLAVIKDENATYRQKQEALEQLKKVGGEYLEMLTMENVLTAEGKRLIDRYISSIDQLAKAKATVNTKAKLEEKRVEAENKVLALSLEKKANTNEGSLGGSDGLIFGMGSRNKRQIQLEIDDEKTALNILNLQIKELDKSRNKQIEDLRKSIVADRARLKKLKEDSDAYKMLLQDINSKERNLNILLGLEDASSTGESTNKKATVVEGDDKASKAAERLAAKSRKIRLDAMNKALEDAKKAGQDTVDLERRIIDERLALIQDGLEKEEALENEAHRRKLEDLKKQLVDEVELAKLEEKINDSSLSPKERDAYMHIREAWVEKNKQINTLIELEQGRHEIALATISEKGETKRLQDLQRAFDREGILRETAHNEELAAFSTKESAKKYITDKFNKAYFAEGATEEQKKAAMATYKAEIESAYNVNLAKEKLQKKFDQDELQRQVEHLNKMLAEKERILADDNSKMSLDLLTEEQKKSLQDDVDQLKLKISELLKAKAELSGNGDANNFASSFANADILGFTADQWQRVFDSLDTVKGKLDAAQMVVSSLQNIWGQYNAYVEANENASLRKYEKGMDARKKKLKWQLDNGYINQVQYTKGLEQLDADLDKKKSDLEYKQAKRQKQMAIIDAIINTAKGVTSALGMAPPASYVFAALTAAMGAIQIATIAKQPLPARGYEEGLYPEYVQREQDGKMFKAGYGGKTRSGMVNKPTLFLAGENGPEMIIDAKAYRQISPSTKALLINELRRVKGFEQGYYNNDVTGGGRIEVPAATSGGTSDAVMLRVAMALEENTAVMRDLRDSGVTAYYSRDNRDLKKMMEDMDKVTNSRKKAQR